MAFSNTYVFGFATTICVTCSLALSVVSTSLRDLQEANKRRDVQSNILTALDMTDPANPPYGEAIDKLYEEGITEVFILPSGEPATAAQDQDKDGDLDEDDCKIAAKNALRQYKAGNKKAEPAVLAIYQKSVNGKLEGAAIPLSGVGLWGPISGYIAINPKAEIIGAAFFAPKETPGLGAEIVNEPFEGQWKGKKLMSKSGPATVDVVKGKPSEKCADRIAHCVSGISGATITSNGVDEMVDLAVQWYGPYLKNLTGGVK